MTGIVKVRILRMSVVIDFKFMDSLINFVWFRNLKHALNKKNSFRIFASSGASRPKGSNMLVRRAKWTPNQNHNKWGVWCAALVGCPIGTPSQWGPGTLRQ